MQHTSGIPEILELLADRWPEAVTSEDMLAEIAAVPELAVEPGTRYSYSNSGYVLLAAVVEAVDGRPVSEFLADEVFAPAGVEAVMDPFLDSRDRATGYVAEAGKFKPFVLLFDSAGPGGVQITASELAEWGGQYWNPTVGGKELLAARTADAVPASREQYGAGILIEDMGENGPRLSHRGELPGWTADLVILPKLRLAAAVTCNLGFAQPSALAVSLLSAYQQG